MDAVLVLSNEQRAARTKRLCTSTVAEHFQPPLAWRRLMFAQVTIASSTPFRTTVEMIDFENLSMPQVMMRYKHQCVSRAPGGFGPGTQNLSG
jgi:hypothetical protein